jgi:hypothetical protein
VSKKTAKADTEWAESELEAVAAPSLQVNVDVNALLVDHSEAEVFDLLAKLKDLLA